MFYGQLNFTELPSIGFAHHFYKENSYQQQYNLDTSFELVYLKSGDLIMELYGQSFHIPSGSLIVLFRHLPIRFYMVADAPHAHCSVQVKLDYSFELKQNISSLPQNFNGLIFPFIIHPCQLVEEIKKELYGVISDLNVDRNTNHLSASLAVAGILRKIDAQCRKSIYTKSDTISLLSYQIKRLVAHTLHRNLSLSDLAGELGKTPNYLNAVFKKSTGMTIRQYINEEKVHLIADLIENMDISFSEACESVGIADVSYGYRLFKKHTGITPKGYLSTTRLVKK